MFTVPKLNYGYDAFKGYISEELMHYHLDRHHQTYVDKLNAVVASNPSLEARSLDDLLSNLSSLPEAARTGIRNHGGGHYNHSLYWDSMSPNGGGQPNGRLAEVLNDKYGSFQNFVDQFSAQAMAVFGSGWAILLPDGSIVTTPNQDTPIGMGLSAPLMCLDVWEHAYYLDYKNKRDDHIKAWWNVVDWQGIEKRFEA
jgi:superoxide dismutase, Fe-Mn family